MKQVFITLAIMTLAFGRMSFNHASEIDHVESLNGNELSQRLQGRDIVRLGERITIEGSLRTEHGEWFLTVNDQLYELHLGDHKYREETGIKIREGIFIRVEGFHNLQEGSDIIDIAVCSIIIDEEEFLFREADGTPLWRGRGAREAHRE